ncbi:MAG: M48 family metallopeptidase [Caulobacterales bacterium]|nr:M48 family metallopeptidase [Caulobacterales bacterium]
MTPNRTTIALMAAGLVVGPLAACTYNEALGRDQLVLVNEDSLAQAGLQAWTQALEANEVSHNRTQNERLRRVGGRIVQAAGLGNQTWEYAVFVSEQPNAFVLPGGRMGVTTALLHLAATDDQLATVIGHEAAHVLARHAAERYSQTAMAQTGLQIATGVAGDYGPAVGALGGIGAQVGVLLPFSRQHELEADRIGVDLMQRAGYNPREAVTLWRAMAAQGGASAPEFASTHPSDSTRITALEAYLQSRGW